MKNEIDEALDYTIEQFEGLIENGSIDNIPSGVCALLWDSKKFSDKTVDEIAEIGKWKNRSLISRKYIGVNIGNLWWFHGDEIGCAKARLEVLKLIRDERIQRGSDTETAD